MNRKILFRTMIVALVVLLASAQVWAQTPQTVTCGNGKKYLASEIKQLVDFLNLPSQTKGETNAQALGYTVKITMNNVHEWGFGSPDYKGGVHIGSDWNFEETDGIRYIRDLKIESSAESQYAARLGGHLQIQNFKYLKIISLYKPYFGEKISVKNCPDLKEFWLDSAESWGGNEEAPGTERQLEIKNCPSLHTLNISSLLTDFETDNFALENVSIRRTNMPCVDFSKQKQLKNLTLTGNQFAQIDLPKRSDYSGNMYEGDFSYNAMEPANWVSLIRAYYGDSLFYETDYSTGKLKFDPEKKQYIGNVWNQVITVCDPVTGSDSLSVGSKIDLSSLASLQYGVPAVTSKAAFNWVANGKNVDGQYPMLTETPEMKKGILTIPNNMMGTTITCLYSASPLLPDAYIKYLIKVSSKPGKTTNFVANNPPSCGKDKKPKVEDKKEYWVVETVANPASGGTVSGGGSCEMGKSASPKAQATDSTTFYKWTLHTPNESNPCQSFIKELGTDLSFEFPKPNDDQKAYKIIGHFKPIIKEYNVVASSNNIKFGTVSGSGVYKSGQTAQIVATPTNEGEFVEWKWEYTVWNNTCGKWDTKTGTATDSILSLSLLTDDFHKKTVLVQGIFEEKSPFDSIQANPNPYLALTSNLSTAVLTGSAYYKSGKSVSVSVTDPSNKYVFQGWYQGKKLITKNTSFDFPLKRDTHLRAIFDNVPPAQTSSVNRKYVSEISFYDDKIPESEGSRVEMEAMAVLKISANNDLPSPYRTNNAGAFSVDLGDGQRYRVDALRTYSTPVFLPMTIFQVTDKEIIAGAGGYTLTVIRNVDLPEKAQRIPYTLNTDGSITLKNFDVTGTNPAGAQDITFYPINDDELPVRWFPRPKFADITHSLVKRVMPKIVENLGLKE